MSDAGRYAVWAEPRSRSRSLKGSRPSVPHGTSFLTLILFKNVSYLLLVAESVGVEVSLDSGAATRVTDATDDDSSSTRRNKQYSATSKHRVDAAAASPYPPASVPRRLTNPYSDHATRRKKVHNIRVLCPLCDDYDCAATPVWQNSQLTGVTTLRAKLSGAVYCYRSCLWACLQRAGGVCLCACVCVWVCYHDNSKLRALILTKLGP